MNALKNSVRYSLINLATAPNVFRHTDQRMRKPVAELKQTGYHALKQFFTQEEAASIRAAMTKAIDEGRSSFSEHLNYHVIQSPLSLAPCVSKAVGETITDIAEAYFRRKVYLADVDCRRVFPSDKEVIYAGGLSSSNWHKDTRGRQLKLMVYLTNVEATDSSFAFLPGTHAQRTFDYKKSRYPDETIGKHGTPTDWLGKKGDAMIFDTNIIHRLTRRETARVRDSITFYFTPGQSLRKIDATALDPNLAKLCEDQPTHFKRPQ